jgi:general secretion pathway protein J
MKLAQRALRRRVDGFTLVELLAALLMLSLLSLLCYRGLSAVLDARDHVRQETDKWRSVASFLARFEQDVLLAAPRPVRTVAGTLAPWRGQARDAREPQLELTRFASTDMDNARRVASRLNAQQEIELWLWPGLDMAPAAAPARYPVLGGVTRFDIHYLGDALAWADAWPASARDAPIPLAVRLRLVLASGEEIVRVFALR